MRQPDASRLQAINQRQHAVEGIHQRCGVEQLRADVAGDAGDTNAGHARGFQIQALGFDQRDAELVVLEARRDIGMSLGIDIRVHPQRDVRLHAGLLGHRRQATQL